MRNLLFTVFLVAAVLGASAQKVYFIYLQSDNYRAFYVKMGDRILSSSSSGYLILSNLPDSTYSFLIGFPSASSESRFNVPVEGKDRGFLIKELDAGLSLFDWQKLTIISAQKDESPKNISYQRRNDDFSGLLSRAAKDTSLLYAIVRTTEVASGPSEPPKTEAPAENTAETIHPKDTAVVQPQADPLVKKEVQDTAKTTGANPVTSIAGTDSQTATLPMDSKDTTHNLSNPVLTTDPVGLKKDSTAVADRTDKPTILGDTTADLTVSASESKAVATDGEPVVFKRSQVKKHSEASTSEGFGLVFYDRYDGGTDTIGLLIPNPPILFKQPGADTSAVQSGFLHVEDLRKDSVEPPPIVVAVKNSPPVQAKCRSVASSSDFFKLRKNMAAENTDEGMVGVAKKAFKSKCYTTEQIKNLSGLFLTSAGKYEFFDAAYLHVTDQAQFSSLESEIKDDYYLKRFKALVGE